MWRKLATALALTALTSTAFAADKSAEAFVKEAIQGNYAEVKMGKLAQSNGENAGVRGFGETLVTDHQAANEKAINLAKELKIEAPTGPSAQQTKEYEKLAALKGTAFDREFTKHMVKDHNKDIDAYTKASKTSNKSVASYASETLPTLKKHLLTAKGLPGGQS